MKRKFTIPLLIIVVLLGWLFYSKAKQNSHQSPAPTPASVTVSPVIQKDVMQKIQAVGNVQPYTSVSITSQVNGQLLSVGFKEGEMVEKGQILFRIDPKTYVAQLQQAEANLMRDKAQLENAHSLVVRNQKLLPGGFVAKQDFEQLQSNEQALIATIKADQAAVDNAKIQLDYCTIHAPISGRTGGLLVYPGNVVTANGANALVVINQVTPIYVSFSIPEQYLSTIHQEYNKAPLDVTALLDKIGKQEINGKLTFINNDVDTTTGTIQLKATFENADHLLWPGQFVTVKLPMKSFAQALLVPTTAVQAGQKGSFVYVMNKEQQQVKYQPVTVGAEIGENTIIEKGLKVGDQVVTSGQFSLVDGAKVQVVKQAIATNDITPAS